MLQASPGWVLRVGVQCIECVPYSHGKGLSVKTITIQIATEQEEDAAVALRRALAQMFSALKQHLESDVAASAVQPDLQVFVSDIWLGVTMLPWSPVFLKATGFVQTARQQFEADGFLVDADTVICVDDAPGFGQMRMAVAYPVWLQEALQMGAVVAQVRLISVLPMCVAAADYAKSVIKRKKIAKAEAAGAVAVLEEDTVRFMYLQSSGVVPGLFARDFRLLDAPVSVLNALWRRQQLRYPALATASRLMLLAPGQKERKKESSGVSRLQGSSLSAQDETKDAVQIERLVAPVPNQCLTVLFAQTVRRFSTLDLLMVPARRSATWRMTAVLLFCVAGAMTFQAIRMAAQVRTQEQSLFVQTRPEPTRVERIVWTRDEVTRVRIVNEAIRQLNLPINAVLRSLIPPRDIRVALLGIDISPDRQTGKAENEGGVILKLSAEALSSSEMARYVSYLGDQKAVAGAYLVRHEVDEALSGQPYRFTVEIVWRE